MSDILLNIRNLTKNYGSKQVLKGINLTIKKGEILSLLGVNGAGKTTLSSIIATLHPASSGDIEYNGVSIYKNIIAFRKILGYCPQAPNLNPMLTLRQNLEVACRYYQVPAYEIDGRIAEVVQQFELAPFLEQKAFILSGGFKQRFMIARSMIHRPAFIILDEPTVGLDPHIRRNLWEVIKSLKSQGITVLLTTHYLDEAEKLSDRVCILDQGHIKLIDTPENLLADFQQTNLEDVFVKLMNNQKE